MTVRYGKFDIDHIIVNFSFGTGSFCAAERMVQEFGKEHILLLFSDTLWEDEDTYKWGRAAADKLGCKLVEICEGRTPWQTFQDANFIGNSRVDPCSKILKREFIDHYLQDYNKYRTLLVFGIHWSEYDRFYKVDKDGVQSGIYVRLRQAGWRHVRAPMCEKPFIGADDMEQRVIDAGLWKQKLYELGFPHANCGGRCCKQGQKGWSLLYKTMPDRFEECMNNEEDMRKRLGDVAMLKEQVDGVKRPLPLIELKRRLDEGKICDEGGMGGCNCFAE